MKIRHKITRAVLLLFFKIVATNAGCYWNSGSPGTECLMYCINSDTTAVNKEIENRYNEDGVNKARYKFTFLSVCLTTCYRVLQIKILFSKII